MRIVGIEIAGSETRLAVLDGTVQDATLSLPERTKIAFPSAGQTEIQNLTAYRDLMISIIRGLGVSRVAVFQATAGSSIQRAKQECLLQLASDTLGYECDLISPNTVATAASRTMAKIASSELKLRIDNIAPGYLERAARTAWCGLNVAGA